MERGEREEALREIAESLSSASRYQQNNFIIQEGKVSTRLLAFAFENDIEREYLISIFSRVGSVALPALAPLLKSDSALVRTAAITALGVAGGAEAAPHLRSLLRDPDQTVRRAANAELARLRSTIDEPEKILTPRENRVLELLKEGLSNAEIAERLFISEPTVKTHVTRIFKKLGMTRRSQAAVHFLKKPGQSKRKRGGESENG